MNEDRKLCKASCNYPPCNMLANDRSHELIDVHVNLNFGILNKNWKVTSRHLNMVLLKTWHL